MCTAQFYIGVIAAKSIQKLLLCWTIGPGVLSLGWEQYQKHLFVMVWLESSAILILNAVLRTFQRCTVFIMTQILYAFCASWTLLLPTEEQEFGTDLWTWPLFDQSAQQRACHRLVCSPRKFDVWTLHGQGARVWRTAPGGRVGSSPLLYPFLVVSFKCWGQVKSWQAFLMAYSGHVVPGREGGDAGLRCHT